MSFIEFVKNNMTGLPYPVGRFVSLLPYDFRPGVSSVYRKRKNEIAFLSDENSSVKKKFIFERVKKIAVYAQKNIPFYTELYNRCDVDPVKFKGFDDLSELPIITKADLQDVPLEYRSAFVSGRMLVNTGGSSGQPLELFVEPSSIAHEWAHMHHIWKKLEFRQNYLKVVFGGIADVRGVVQYDSARHQINVDLYSGWEAIANKLMGVFRNYRPRYLHGYPSAIFDFVIWLDTNNHPLLGILNEYVFGLFLGSEFPSPVLRKNVEKLLDCSSVSWYGHTERAVLAYENKKHGVYSPFITYGHAESPDGGRLICTSYYNMASPLIRYDTGDIVEPFFKDGILENFTITDGREGEFIVDKKGNRISLTGLIFGRHHGLFELARHVQIHQPRPGIAEVLVSPRTLLTPEAASMSFDSKNVDVDFIFKIIRDPIRTKSGKVPLLLREPK